MSTQPQSTESTMFKDGYFDARERPKFTGWSMLLEEHCEKSIVEFFSMAMSIAGDPDIGPDEIAYIAGLCQGWQDAYK